MKSDFSNTVIVIGGDHHNTLAVVRCLGKKGCSQKVLIHTHQNNPDRIYISKSKYVAGKIFHVEESEGAIVQWLLANVTEHKQILFPCSDLAAYAIDANHEQLAPYYVLPGFKNAPGRVCELMDKWQQKKYAEKHNLPMAHTWKLNITSGFCIPTDMVYPCIVKPEISAFGRKSDIVICDGPEALSESLANLAAMGYKMLVVQQFLHKEYEVCAYGCLLENREHYVGGTICKVREYPPCGGGSLTFARFIDEEDVNALRNRVLDILHDEGYRGQYDIEIFACKDGVYLNEINFRHSGNGYGLIQNGVPAPYIWCADAVCIKIDGKIRTTVKTGKYHMDELTDLRHVKDRRISFLTWIRDCMRTSAFSKLDISDINGTLAYYIPFFSAVVGKVIPRRRK